MGIPRFESERGKFNQYFYNELNDNIQPHTVLYLQYYTLNKKVPKVDLFVLPGVPFLANLHIHVIFCKHLGYTLVPMEPSVLDNGATA